MEKVSEICELLDKKEKQKMVLQELFKAKLFAALQFPCILFPNAVLAAVEKFCCTNSIPPPCNCSSYPVTTYVSHTGADTTSQTGHS